MHTKLAAATCSLILLCGAAQAADIKVLASGAVKEIVTELLPQYENSTGNKVAITWSGTATIKKKIADGDIYDLVIVGSNVIDSFTKDGKIRPGSRVDLVRSGVGVAVKSGAAKPDISSADALKKSLLAAKAVFYSTGPSGVYVQKLIERLGVADQVKAKTTISQPGTRISQFLTQGDGGLGFQQVAELIHEKGIDFVGPLPPDVQNITVFASGIHTGATQADAAKTFQAFLISPATIEVVKKNGMEPAASR